MSATGLTPQDVGTGFQVGSEGAARTVVWYSRTMQCIDVPGGQFDDETKPEACFATEEDARAAGYTRSRR